MSNPILTSEDIVRKMRAGTKEVHQIRLGEQDIPVRVLSINETNRIRQEAIKKTLLEKGDEVDRNVVIQKLTLKLASTIPRDGVPILSEKVLDDLSVDEVNYLYSEYVAAMESVNPSIERIEPKEFALLVELLKKNHVSSKDLNLRQLKAICTAYQDLIQKPAKTSLPTVN